MAMTLRLKIFPNARWLRFKGVTSKVAIVPRSFSPAIDSGATAIQPLNRNAIISIGTIMENICAEMSSSEARSYPSPPGLMSNLFARADS